jgi:hypothetical protein
MLGPTRPIPAPALSGTSRIRCSESALNKSNRLVRMPSPAAPNRSRQARTMPAKTAMESRKFHLSRRGRYRPRKNLIVSNLNPPRRLSQKGPAFRLFTPLTRGILAEDSRCLDRAAPVSDRGFSPVQIKGPHRLQQIDVAGYSISNRNVKRGWK